MMIALRLNTSFGNAIKYLLESPPYPEWIYNFEKENINEILIYESVDLVKAYGEIFLVKMIVAGNYVMF